MATALSSSQPPVAEYGADEISALVLDPGYSVTRAGFAGEDTPKSVIPSFYGTIETEGEDGNKRVFYNDHALSHPSHNLDVRNPMSKDGIVEDWDMAAKLWEYSITSRLTNPKQKIEHSSNGNGNGNGNADVEMEDMQNNEKPLSDSPLLMSEPGWNPTKNREKTIELAMEDWGCPAFFMARSGVLAAFASGKPSALVIDLGASTASVIPVWDGIMLKKGLQKSTLAGNWVSDQVRLLYSQSQPPITINPHYMIVSKTAVEAGAAAQAVLRSFPNSPKHSFRRYHEERVLTEFKESCVQVWNPARNNHTPLAGSVDYIKTNEPGKTFEMPDGWNQLFNVDRFRVVEGMFDEKAALTDPSNPTPPRSSTLPGLLQSALSNIDVDTRSHTLAHIVLTGGTSLISGMADRVNYEIQNMYPGPRVRLQAPGNVIERKYASWIGGSILASLGTFHQMWISKKEYEEHGAGIVERRCK